MKVEFGIKVKDFALAQYVVITSILILGLFRYLITYVTGHDDMLGFLRIIDVGEESSIPTYFSTLNLVLSSLFALIIYKIEKATNRNKANYWLFLAVLFLFLSIDEGVSIHENFDYVARYLERHGVIPPLLETHKWLTFGVLFVLVTGVILYPFIRSLSRHTALYLTIGALVFIVGAIGFEYVGSWMLHTGLAKRNDLIFKLRRILEEGCEMYGVAIINCVLLEGIFNGNVTLLLKGVSKIELSTNMAGFDYCI